MDTVKRFLSKTSLLWVIIYFILMTMVMTWPLVTRMSGSIVGQLGDNIYFVWMIGWFKKALFDLHVNPFNVWFLNYPEGWSLAYTEITPAQILIALPFSLIGSPTLAYNAALMICFVLSGLGMYIWVRHLTGRFDAALIAGTIFAFIPFRFAHFLIGHLNLSGTQWFPFYFMGFFDLLESKKWSWKPVLLAGISLGLIGLTSQYYLYMVLILSAFMGVCYLLFIERAQLNSQQFWKGMAYTAVVALPLVLVAVAPYVSLVNQGAMPDRNLGILEMYSASPTDFILPSTQHFLWGQWIGAHFNRDMWVEGTLYIGLVSAVLGLLAWLKRKELAHRNLIVLMLWGGIFAFVMAMGIDFHWLGQEITIQTPAFLSRWVHRASFPILLPGYLFFRYFPLYAKLRSLMRFGVFVLVFSSAAAGLGAAWLLKKVAIKWQAVAALALLTLVFIDFYPGPYQQFSDIKARPVDTWLASQPGMGAVVQFPFSIEQDQEQTYYTLIHGKPYVGGFFNAFPPAQYNRITPLMDNFPDQQSVSLAHQLGVQYVLVSQKYYPDLNKLEQQCQALGLYLASQQGDQLVFEFKQ